MTHICVIKLTIIGSNNGLSPDRRQAIFWTNDGLLLIGPLGTNFSEILIEILTFSFKKRRLKVSSAKRRPFCLGLNVLECFCSIHTTEACITGSYLNAKSIFSSWQGNQRTNQRTSHMWRIHPCFVVGQFSKKVKSTMQTAHGHQ